MKARVAPFVALALGLAGPAHARGLPDWLEAALETASPAASSTLHAHRLVHEQRVTYAARGRNIVFDRGAVRVLDRTGADAARVWIPYDQQSARVRSLKAWVLDPGGRARALGDRDAADVSLAEWGTLKSEERARVVTVTDVAPGGVFAWEWTLEEEPLFADWRFEFGDEAPTAVERFEVELPPGVEPQVLPFGPGVPAPQHEGAIWRWERRDVPAIPDEASSASARAWADWFVVAPHVVGAANALPGQRFGSWEEVARWLAGIAEASASPTPAIAGRAAGLVSAAGSPLAGVRSLARSVQSVNYVSVAVGLAHGEGYRPHPAEAVMQAGYGDCKDMASLFCSLVRAAGMKAWLVSASTEGRDHVRAEWPSPGQFNHCIAAVEVPAGTGLAAARDTTPVGPLLFFDATDRFTPLGALPERLQGSWALLEVPANGRLLRLPVPRADHALSRWTVSAEMDSAGGLAGTWVALERGSAASRERQDRSAGEAAWRAGMERSLSDWLGASTITRLEARDLPDSDEFHFTLHFRADRFGRRMGSRLLSFCAAPLTTPYRWESLDSTRRTPIELNARSHTDSVVVRLPPGWEVDELPRHVAQEHDFGGFSADWTARGDAVTFTLASHREAVTLPPDRYPELLAFWTGLRRALRSQVVLALR